MENTEYRMKNGEIGNRESVIGDSMPAVGSATNMRHSPIRCLAHSFIPGFAILHSPFSILDSSFLIPYSLEVHNADVSSGS
jgi:hypothetical protein